ncbi:unnamed protein product [Mytilus coruscus]|uniref:Mutator-like transposase domain-containing protein n=1 Tax=Mytilus coruscus TaxID=42192 RepID=A0A6J8DHJ0_MYTCO|nr:unnamed protein product [Mytilus coruscus]
MKKKLETVKDVNRIRGVKEPSHIPVAIDTRYNSAWLKGKGLDVTCPDGHAGTCTANVKPTTPLSEYLMGKEIGLQVDRQNVLIKYAVTDGDGRGAEGINDALKVLHPLWKVERQADPIHLGRSQFRQSNSANFSLNMFSGSTREKKKQGQKVLSQDLKARCSLVFNEMWKENCGNLEKIKKCLPRVLDATVRCYTEAIFESHDEIHVKDDTYRAVKMKKITLLINVVVNLHNLQDIKCENPNFELTKVIKYGSGVKCIYKCTKCKFTSPRVNLFDEIKTSKPGPNPGELTRMFVSALQETPMGIKRRRFLMAAGLNIPPPTKKEHCRGILMLLQMRLKS